MAHLSKPPTRNRGVYQSPVLVFCCLMLLFSMAPVAIYSHPDARLIAVAVALGVALMCHLGRRLPATADRYDEVPGQNPVTRARQSDHPTPASGSSQAAASGRPGDTCGDVVLISRNSSHIAAVTDCLSAWGRSCCVVENSVEAARRLLNQRDSSTPAPKVLIVDGLSLEIDPARLPALLGAESDLSRTRMLCLSHPASPETVRRLLAAGYAGLLESPVIKSQLFSLMHGTPGASLRSDKVIELGHHRQLPNRGSKKKSILLAEHNTTERGRLEQIIRKAGHRVFCVKNGEQALDALEQQYFDMAIINLRLPIMNGTQVVKLHRFTTPHQRWVPFIVITDQNNPATLRLCRELNIQACLFKPAPTAELLDTIAATAVAERANSTAVPRPPPVERRQETRFLHGDLLDRKILMALDQLDNGQEFLPELIEVFKRDCRAALHGMQQAVDNGEPERFFSLSGTLQDNAGQLGAFALYEMCLGLDRLESAEFETAAGRRLQQLSELVTRTSLAFRDYLEERKGRQSDQS